MKKLSPAKLFPSSAEIAKERERDLLNNLNIKYDLQRHRTLNEVMYELQKCYSHLGLFKAMTLKDFKIYLEQRYPEISYEEEIIYHIKNNRE